MTVNFGDRLTDAIKQKRTPLVVGLDPRVDCLPGDIISDRTPTRDTVTDVIVEFCCGVIDVVAPLVPAVKPQAAFFELLGPPGMFALAKVVDHARQARLLVIMDAKRGDIGSTATAYANAFLGKKSPWGCDALTVNPYLGHDSLTPFVSVAEETGSGVFVLAKTSNPGSQTLQELSVNGEPVYSIVARHIQTLASNSVGDSGYGCVGAVAGATYPDQLCELRQLMPNAILLVPGFGAQGGTAADVAGGFDETGLGAVVNSSRAIVFAYDRDEYRAATSWQAAVEQATRDAIEELASATNAGKLRRPK
jgi:orotidine-5'-phosphate decarboxylase